MPLPNTGMSFTPLDPLPASDLNDLVENIEALADGTGLNTGAVTVPKLGTGVVRLGLGTGSGATLTTSYVTHSTVTATSYGGTIELQWGAQVANGNSGADRNFTIQILCDGSSSGITPATLNFDNPSIAGVTTNLYYGFIHNQTGLAAGSHTWTLQFLASAGSAVILSANYLKVKEVR